MKNATGECVASGQGCRYGPYGPNGAEQCEFCGEARSTAAQPAGAKLTPDQVVAIADSHAHGDWVDNYLNLIRDVCDAALAGASGDSTPPSEPAEPIDFSADLTKAKNLLVRIWDRHPEARPMIEGATGRWFVWGTDRDASQGDPSGALRPEPEAVGQDRVRAWSEAPGAERVWTCKIGGPVAGIPKGSDSPMRAAVSQAFEQITGFEARFIFSGWGGELTEGERAVVENRPAMPTFEVRVAGPDDVFSYSDELFALRHANSVNQAYLADRAKHPDSEVLCVATVHAAEPPQAASGCSHTARSDGAKE